jgi:sugar lactone lactonase YvrE
MGTNARFSNPEGIAVDRDGNIFVADAGNRSIRKIARSGEVTTLRSLDGKIYLPGAVATDRDGNVYIAERDALCTSPHGPCYPNPNVRNITRITPGNVVTVVAMTGVAATASFSNLQVDSAGNVYVTDTNNSTISKMTPDGSVTVVAGRAGAFGVVPGDLPAVINRPLGLAIHADTSLFTISENSVLRIQLPQDKRP